jgi:hypothetical protein
MTFPEVTVVTGQVLVNSSEDPSAKAAAAGRLNRAELEKAISGDLPQIAEPNAALVRRSLFLATVTASLYWVILCFLAFCVLVLIIKTRPPEMDPAIKNPLIAAFRVFFQWFAPILGGATVVGTMILAVRARKGVLPEHAVYLNPNSEDVLYEFMKQLCAKLSIPVPRIFISPRPEIKVRRIPAPPDTGEQSKLELCLGLPLVSTLTVRQLAGLITRELAPFRASGTSGAAQQKIVELYEWLEFLAGYKSGLEESMEQLAETKSRFSRCFGVVAKYMVSLMRGIVRGILFLLRATSSRQLRATSLQADVLGASVAGSQDYVGVISRLPLIESAIQYGMHGLTQTVRLGRLPENYPDYVANRLQALPEDQRRSAQDSLNKQGKNWLDLEPTFSERLRTAMQLRAPGIVRIDKPASVLFNDYNGATREITMNFAQETFGPHEVASTILLPNEEFYERCAPELVMQPLDLSVIESVDDDRLSHWLRLARHVSAIVLTGIIIVTTVFQLYGVYKTEFAPEEVRYRNHIGLGLAAQGHFRRVNDVVWYNKGDLVTDSNVKGEPVIAEQTGWYYDLGKGIVVYAKNIQEERFISLFGAGNMPGEVNYVPDEDLADETDSTSDDSADIQSLNDESDE